MDHDLGETGQKGAKALPEPAAHVLDRGILEPGNVIEVGVVELFEQGIHRAADAGVIVEPSRHGIGLPLHGDLHLEAVPVHPPAFVIGGHLGKGLRRLEREILGQSDIHDGLVITGARPPLQTERHVEGFHLPAYPPAWPLWSLSFSGSGRSTHRSSRRPLPPHSLRAGTQHPAERACGDIRRDCFPQARLPVSQLPEFEDQVAFEYALYSNMLTS